MKHAHLADIQGAKSYYAAGTEMSDLTLPHPRGPLKLEEGDLDKTCMGLQVSSLRKKKVLFSKSYH